jgi:hypothetical protein
MKNSFEIPLWPSAFQRMTKPAPPEKPYRLSSTPSMKTYRRGARFLEGPRAW